MFLVIFVEEIIEDLKHHRCHCLEYTGQVPGGQSLNVGWNSGRI